MHYSLYNKTNDKLLTHPVVGVWHTSDLDEAKSMLEDCRIHLKSRNLDSILDNFVIVDMDTKEEVKCL